MKKKLNENHKKCTFVPYNLINKEIPNIIIGDDFNPQKTYDQDFYHTGEYFLLFHNDDPNSDIRVFVIYFDSEKSCLEYKVLRIQVPFYESYKTRTTIFDPVGGKVIHHVENLVTRDDKTQHFVYDLYYFNVGDFLDMNLRNYIIKEIIIKPKAKDVTLSWDWEEYNYIEHDFGFREKNETSLVIKAFYSERDDEGRDIGDFPPYCRIDIFKLLKNGMLHSNRIDLDFEESIELTESWPRCHVTPDRIYFYGEIEVDDPKNERYIMGLEKVDEYDFNGNFLHSYSIPNMFLRGQLHYIDDATHVFIYKHPIKLQDNFLRIVKLKEGKALAVSEFGDSVKYQKASANYEVFEPLKRFGQFIWHFSIKKNEMLQQYSYSITSLSNGQKLLELMDFGGKQLTYSVNWNISEIGRTFYDSNQNFVFKISRRKTPESFALKHLARMAVLTCFNEEYLSVQNLPKTLFEYLGVIRSL